MTVNYEIATVEEQVSRVLNIKSEEIRNTDHIHGNTVYPRTLPLWELQAFLMKYSWLIRFRHQSITGMPRYRSCLDCYQAIS